MVAKLEFQMFKFFNPTLEDESFDKKYEAANKIKNHVLLKINNEANKINIKGFNSRKVMLKKFTSSLMKHLIDSEYKSDFVNLNADFFLDVNEMIDFIECRNGYEAIRLNTDGSKNEMRNARLLGLKYLIYIVLINELRELYAKQRLDMLSKLNDYVLLDVHCYRVSFKQQTKAFAIPYKILTDFFEICKEKSLYVYNTRSDIIFKTALVTGIRASELISLSWERTTIILDDQNNPHLQVHYIGKAYKSLACTIPYPLSLKIIGAKVDDESNLFKINVKGKVTKNISYMNLSREFSFIRQKLIDDYQRKSNDDSVSSGDKWKYLEYIKIAKDMTLHCFRSTYLSQLQNNCDLSPRKIKTLIGHAALNMSQKYDNFLQEDLASSLINNKSSNTYSDVINYLLNI